jgi:hypothetical protein
MPNSLQFIKTPHWSLLSPQRPIRVRTDSYISGLTAGQRVCRGLNVSSALLIVLFSLQ